MRKLQIKDIYFGKIDAYNEFLEYGQDTCKGLFYEFPNIDISRLLDGSTYYIYSETKALVKPCFSNTLKV